MKVSKETQMKVLPWLLIVFGFLSLAKIPAIAGFVCMFFGIIMLILRRWPEKWGSEME